jgi:hypothetical protein
VVAVVSLLQFLGYIALGTVIGLVNIGLGVLLGCGWRR